MGKRKSLGTLLYKLTSSAGSGFFYIGEKSVK